MKTVDKAMRVLNTFSVDQCEIGLSELARLTGLDKAATRRLLLALAGHNFIEQNPATRQYRLGTGFLRLAAIRERTVPVSAISRDVAGWLTAETGETAHISMPGAGMLATIAHAEPNRGTIVHLDPSELLPFNATASGIVYLGFLAPAKRQTLLSQPMKTYTASTITDPAKLDRLARKAFNNGYGTSTNGYEDDASGVAVPFFGQTGTVQGTIAIAAPTSRMTGARREAFKALLFAASRRITETLGGHVHPNIPAPPKAA